MTSEQIADVMRRAARNRETLEAAVEFLSANSKLLTIRIHELKDSTFPPPAQDALLSKPAPEDSRG